MRYFFAIVLPPVAVLSCGKLGQAILNVFLWCCGIIPGILHAWGIVSSYEADRETALMIQAFKQIPAKR
jgi:uncharacterized membrane protein YqaE (UPF0057 family)